MYFATEMIPALKINIPTTLLLKDFKKIDISILQNWASYFTETVDYLKSTGRGFGYRVTENKTRPWVAE